MDGIEFQGDPNERLLPKVRRRRWNTSQQLASQNEIPADYADKPKHLEAAIAGLPSTDLDLTPNADGWTIRQIVHQAAEGDDLCKAFVKRVIGNLHGQFGLAWYWQIMQDKWAERWAYQDRAIGPSLALFRASRGHIGPLLEHVPGAWEKSLRIRWPKGEEQEVSVVWVLEMQIRHLEGHLGDIRSIREAHSI